MEKVEKVTFYIAIVLFDMKMHSIQPPRNSKGHGHLVTLIKGQLVSCLSTF